VGEGEVGAIQQGHTVEQKQPGSLHGGRLPGGAAGWGARNARGGAG
jgi:hypothetical protein